MLLPDCVNEIRANMFKNRIAKHLSNSGVQSI